MVDDIIANKSHVAPGEALECLYSVLQQIGNVVTDRADDVRGILLGTKDERRVRILAFRPIVSKRGSGRPGPLSAADREEILRSIASPPAPGELYGLEPVGWFWAQASRDSSPGELELLSSFFTEPRHVGMVLGPASRGPARARFYVRDTDGILGYRELLIPEAPASSLLTVEPEAPRLTPPVEEPPAPAPAPPPPPPETILPPFPSRRPSSAHRIAWVLGVAVLAIGGYRWAPLLRQRVAALPTAADARPNAPPSSTRAAQPANTLTAEPQALTDQPSPNEQGPSDREIADLVRQLKEQEEPKSVPQAAPLSREKSSALPPPRPNPPLRPLRMTPASRPAVKPVELNLPPPLAPAPETAISVPFSVMPLPPEPKRPAPALPRNGVLLWTGRLRMDSTLVIDGSNASFGALIGSLPGQPLRVQVYPGDLNDDGIVVFTPNVQDASAVWDAPGPQNGWNRIFYKVDSRRASGIQVEQAPSPNNSWKRLVLRCVNPKLSIVYVKWSSTR